MHTKKIFFRKKLLSTLFAVSILFLSQNAFPWVLSSNLPIYVGVPIESDVVNETEKHSHILGFSWENCFGGHLGMAIDADFMMGAETLQVYGGFYILYHFNEITAKSFSKFDPYAGIGLGWTSTEGYYSTDYYGYSSYEPVVEFTGSIEAGFNYWFSDVVGLHTSSKFYFNRGFDYLQFNFGVIFMLFGYDIKM